MLIQSKDFLTDYNISTIPKKLYRTQIFCYSAFVWIKINVKTLFKIKIKENQPASIFCFSFYLATACQLLRLVFFSTSSQLEAHSQSLLAPCTTRNSTFIWSSTRNTNSTRAGSQFREPVVNGYVIIPILHFFSRIYWGMKIYYIPMSGESVEHPLFHITAYEAHSYSSASSSKAKDEFWLTKL